LSAKIVIAFTQAWNKQGAALTSHKEMRDADDFLDLSAAAAQVMDRVLEIIGNLGYSPSSVSWDCTYSSESGVLISHIVHLQKWLVMVGLMTPTPEASVAAISTKKKGTILKLPSLSFA
jgi:hypothetical protein